MIRHMKYCLLLLISIILVLLLGGCMDSIDINKRQIVISVAVDKVEDEIWFYVEIANIQAGSSGGSGSGTAPLGSKYFVVKGHGKTLADGRQDVERQLDQPIYISGVRTLIMTERFASNDNNMIQYLYRLRSDETYRKKVLTVTTRSDLDEMFETMNKRNFSVGHSIDETITSLEQQGEAFSRTTARLLENISSRYSGVLIPSFGIRNQDTVLAGYSVVNGSRVTGFIPIEYCKGLNMLKAEKAKTYFDVPYEDKLFTVKTVLVKRAITPVYQNGGFNFLFKLQFKATVEHGNVKTPYHLDNDMLKEMESTLRQSILEQLIMAMDQAKNTYQTDYLQMDDAFRIKYPVLFEQLDWQQAFLSAKVYWDVRADLSVAPALDYESNQVR